LRRVIILTDVNRGYGPRLPTTALEAAGLGFIVHNIETAVIL
jgi:hypothetical protein